MKLNKKLAALITTIPIAFLGFAARVTYAAGDISAVLEPLDNLTLLVRAIGVAIAIIGLSVAGILHMTAGDNPEKKHKAKEAFSAVMVGIVIFAGAPLLSKFFLGV